MGCREHSSQACAPLVETRALGQEGACRAAATTGGPKPGLLGCCHSAQIPSMSPPAWLYSEHHAELRLWAELGSVKMNESGGLRALQAGWPAGPRVLVKEQLSGT